MGLADFDVQKASLAPEQIAVSLTEFINVTLPRLSDKQLEHLVSVLSGYRMLDVVCQSCLQQQEDGVIYDETFDLKTEIAAQIQAVRALRSQVMDGNRVRQGVTARDMKDTVATTTSLISTLMKYHEDMMSLDRRRAMEQATIAVLQELGGDAVVDRFTALLEERLLRESA
jgi:hypothetical protein